MSKISFCSGEKIGMFEKNNCLVKITLSGPPCTSLALDEMHLIGGSIDKSIKIWNLKNGNLKKVKELATMRFQPWCGTTIRYLIFRIVFDVRFKFQTYGTKKIAIYIFVYVL